MKKFTYYLKISYLIFVLLAFAGFGKVAMGQNTINVIGVYSHWETSMCSQNCTNIHVGEYEITEPLCNLPQWTSDRCVFVEGQFVTVKEKPTVAGPFANKNNDDKTIDVRKINVLENKEIKFPEIRIEKSEIEKYQSKRDFLIQMTFENPLDTELKIKIILNSSEQKLTIAPNATQTIDFEAKQTDMLYLNLKIVNDFYDENKQNESLQKAEANGLVVYVSKTIQVE